MRRILYAIALFIAAAPFAAAQTALLVGLQHPPGYRTLLITFRDHKAGLAADIPELIVPRKSGFWRVGGVHKGEESENGDFQEFVYAAPVSSVTKALGVFHPKEPGSWCSSRSEAKITFLNPSLLSVMYGTYTDCPHPESSTQHITYTLEDLHLGKGRALNIRTALGPTAVAAQRKAVPRTMGCGEDEEPLMAGDGKTDPKIWGVARGARTWSLFSDTYDSSCRGEVTYQIPFHVPAPLTGTNYNADALSRLMNSPIARKLEITGGDSILTPAGDFLIIFGPANAPYPEGLLRNSGPLQVFPVAGLSIGDAPALSITDGSARTPDYSVVMVQWAFGQHVAEWESALKAITASPLKEATVAIGDPE
jgi:hypothetical protein